MSSRRTVRAGTWRGRASGSSPCSSVTMKATPETPHRTKRARIQPAVYPDSSPWITAKEMQPKKAAPNRNPRKSMLLPCRSDDSGTLTAARTKATRPKARLNQKIARQLENPTSAPPMTGPSARASPETAAQTPRASARVPRSGYTWRMIDSVPGSLAAAPTPMTTRPAMSQSTLLASAATTEPPQKMSDAGQHDLLATEYVAQHPCCQHEAGECQRVAVDHPLQRGDAGVQVALHVRQSDADDGVVEEGEKKDAAQRRQRECLGGRSQSAFLHVESGGPSVDPRDDRATFGAVGQQGRPSHSRQARAAARRTSHP